MAKIDNNERISMLKENEYQVLLGVDKRTFEKMHEILLKEYNKLHEKGGKPPKLTVLDKLYRFRVKFDAPVRDGWVGLGERARTLKPKAV